MLILKQSTSIDIRMGPFLDATDGVTPETGITLGAADQAEVLKANGAATSAMAGTFAAVTGADGWYDYTASTSDTDTVGEVVFVVQDSSVCLPVFVRAYVVEEAIYDALFAGSAAGFDANGRVDVGSWLGTAVTTSSTTNKPEVDVNSISDDATAANNCESFFDGTGYAGTNNVIPTVTDVTNQAGLITSGTAQGVTATTIQLASGETFADDEIIGATVHIKTATTGAGQTRVITGYTGSTDTATVDTWITTPTGTITYEVYATAPSSTTSLPAVNVTQIEGSDATDQINAACDTAIETYGLQYLVNTALPTNWATDITANSALDYMADDGTAAYDRTTDSLQALRDRGDAAWTTGAGGTPPQLLQSTTIATLASQTSFTLTAGSADDDAYNGAIAVITDSATSTQKAVGTVSNYTGSTKTVTLSADPAIFTMAVGDTIEIIAALGSAGSAPTAGQVADAVWDELQSAHTTAGSFGEIATEIASILVDTAEIGSAGAGLTGIPWNAAWDAEVQSECTDALNAYDPPTKAELDSGLAALNDPTAAAIADAVWDEPTAGHVTAGTTGVALTDTLADTNEIQGDLADGGRLDLIVDGIKAVTDNLPESGALTTLLSNVAAILTDTGTTLDTKINTIDTLVDAIKAKTDNLTFTSGTDLDCNIQKINDVTITGNGQSGTEFGV